MKLSEQQWIFLKNVGKLINFIEQQGYSATGGELFRSQEQAKIYASEGKGIIDSQHCKRLAIDLNIFSPDGEYLANSEDYFIFGRYWKTLNLANRWGGDFPNKDGNHFEMKDGI